MRVRDQTILCYVHKGFAYIFNVQITILVLDLNWMCLTLCTVYFSIKWILR